MIAHNTTPGTLGAVKRFRSDALTLPQHEWLTEFLGTIVQGGSYLLGGAPGSCKSTLAMQIALDLAQRDRCSLIIPTEEPPMRLLDRAGPMMTNWEPKDIIAGHVNICAALEPPDIENLPLYLARQVLSPDGLYHCRNIKLVILDSVQGQGLPAAATQRYERLLEAVRLLSAANVTSLLINHVTKKNELAGPRTLEHAVDAVLVLRKTPASRMLFCLKNRFGPADLRKPLVLQLDPMTLRLSPSPLAQAIVASAATYIGGRDVSHVQAAVALASLGRRGRATAQGIPKAEIQQIVACLSRLPDVDLDDLDFSIHCRVPGQRRFVASIGLALAMALLGSYYQKPIPSNHVYLGEIDLSCAIRPLGAGLLAMLQMALRAGAELSAATLRIFCHPATAIALRGEHCGEGIETVACERVEQAMYGTWPDLH